TPTDDLPLEQSPTDQKVVGHYRAARISYSTMAKLESIMFDYDILITANKEGGINLKEPGEKETTTYVEVKPGVYQKVQKEENDTKQQYLYVEFNEKDEVFRINFFASTDFLPITSVLDTQLFNFIAFGV
ncbi:hypothetical protein, partial [Enterococcus silesiacus]